MKPILLDQPAQTRLEIQHPVFLIDIRIRARSTTRRRRALALVIYRQITRILKMTTDGFIRHSDCGSLGFTEEDRGLSLAQAPDIGSKPGILGYQMRMVRLKLGLTQKSFATLIGINRHHLSKLEKGKHRIRLKNAANFNRILELINQPQDERKKCSNSN